MTQPDRHDAWNPGLTSEIPQRLMPLVTLYRPENARNTYAEAREAAEFCGLRAQDMAALRPSRLVVHEVLIRVTADIWVPDGPNYEDLGLSLRSMAARIIDDHIALHMDEIEARFAGLRSAALERIAAHLDRDIYAPPVPVAEPAPRGLLARLTGRRPPPAPPPATAQPPELAALTRWEAALAEAAGDPLETACLEELLRVVGGAVGRRGRLYAERETVLRLTADRVCNGHGSRQIGAWIAPLVAEAVARQGYRTLPAQKAPVIMNVKGASAAGKSSIRPLQKELAERLDLPWQDFALVSPDYWRKFLLDYDSLGADYKYAAMLTGQELEIIDRKLDRHIEGKAAQARLSHLLIDRFRFDSFASSAAPQGDGRLLSRFGQTVFLFLIITPPAETVTRAWQRGLTTGRFKAVDDLLYHNIEAYEGMPALFLSWVNKTDQTIHFEFLDNGVPLGERPRTVAFGWNAELTVLDIEAIRCMTRYRAVNVEATRPDDVLMPPHGKDTEILAEFVARVPRVTFADPETLAVLGRTENGACVFGEDGFFERAGLGHLPRAAPAAADAVPAFDATRERRFTVGAWSRRSRDA